MTRLARSKSVQAMVAPGRAGGATYRVDIPMTWIEQHAQDTGELDPCLFIAPASDGAAVCVLSYMENRVALIQFIEMSLADMVAFQIEVVPGYLVNDVFPEFQAVMRKLTGADQGKWGSGKSRHGLN
jgi:hypothetical protein